MFCRFKTREFSAARPKTCNETRNSPPRRWRVENSLADRGQPRERRPHTHARARASGQLASRGPPPPLDATSRSPPPPPVVAASLRAALPCERIWRRARQRRNRRSASSQSARVLCGALFVYTRRRLLLLVVQKSGRRFSQAESPLVWLGGERARLAARLSARFSSTVKVAAQREKPALNSRARAPARLQSYASCRLATRRRARQLIVARSQKRFAVDPRARGGGGGDVCVGRLARCSSRACRPRRSSRRVVCRRMCFDVAIRGVGGARWRRRVARFLQLLPPRITAAVEQRRFSMFLLASRRVYLSECSPI